jgi:septal ring factor EnvC (AmiA/AmiB activator)
VSSVPRHSEEELRQQWAFLDALVDRQAASLKSGVQDPEEDDVTVPMVAANPSYLEEISTLTQRVSTLEDERTALLRRIDLAEQARMAAESARAAAETSRQAAERALADERSRVAPDRVPAQSGAIAPKATSAKPRRKSWWQRIRG